MMKEDKTRKSKGLSEEKVHLAILIAKLYFEQERTEQQIGHELGLSRPTVHRLLRDAVDKGLVTVKVVTTSAFAIQNLKEKIKRRFPILKSIHIASGVAADRGRSGQGRWAETLLPREEKLGDVASLAGRVFLNHLRALPPGSTVAVGPGRLNRLIVSSLPPDQLDLDIVPTNGYLYERATEYSANQVGTSLSEVIGGRFHWLPCIGIMEIGQEKVVRHLPLIGQALEMVDHASLVLTGVRDFRSEDLERYKMLFPQKTIDEYTRAIKTENIPMPIGLLCDHPFTSEGAWNEGQGPMIKKHCVIGLKLRTLEELSKPRGSGTVIMAVMSDTPQRTEAVRAALNAKYANVLVTDEDTARALLQPPSSSL